MNSLDQIENRLAELITEAMYMELNELEKDALFSSFGLESTTLVKIISKVNDEFKTTVQIRDILPHQTLAGSAKIIHLNLAGEEA